MPDESPSTSPESPTPEVSVAPGWYAVNQERNTQAYWDGEHWAKTRRWRGTGWVEDSDDPVATGVGTGREGAAPRASRYLPPSARTPSAYPPSPYPPSMGAPQPTMARPMVQTTNGSAVASLVLSILGLFGIGSLLGIIFGYKARREIRGSGGYQSGDGLAIAGIVIGYVTLAIFVLFVVLWIAVFTTIHSSIDSASSQPVAHCQADTKTVEIAIDAYQAQKGSYPAPPAAWSASTYASNYAPLTSGTDGGPYLSEPPATNEYVVEYDSSGNVWVAPADAFEPVAQPNQDISANVDACNTAVSG